MKKILCLALITLSLNVNAKAQFRWDSKLPSHIKPIVAATVQYACKFGHSNVLETETTVEKVHIDQNMYDYFYTTNFKVVDSRNNEESTLTVVSFDIMMSNPTAGVSVGVESIQSDAGLCR